MNRKVEKHIEMLIARIIAKVLVFVALAPIVMVIIQFLWVQTFVEYGYDWLTLSECFAVWFVILIVFD